MYVKTNNPDNLKLCDIQKEVSRVKILIINSDNEILLCNVEGKYSFVGGHVNNGETLTEALNRELREETGLDIVFNNIYPFLKIETLSANHYNTGVSCLSQIFYYSICADEKYDVTKMDLDEEEKNKNFYLEYVDIDVFRAYLCSQINKLNSDLYREMLYVLDYYKNNYRGIIDEKKI